MYGKFLSTKKVPYILLTLIVLIAGGVGMYYVVQALTNNFNTGEREIAGYTIF